MCHSSLFHLILPTNSTHSLTLYTLHYPHTSRKNLLQPCTISSPHHHTLNSQHDTISLHLLPWYHRREEIRESELHLAAERKERKIVSWIFSGLSVSLREERREQVEIVGAADRHHLHQSQPQLLQPEPALQALRACREEEKNSALPCGWVALWGNFWTILGWSRGRLSHLGACMYCLWNRMMKPKH